MASLPSPVRAALGLAARVVDEAKTLPDKAIELPMLAINRALKLSLRAQQHYSSLAARGDEVLAARKITDQAPEWATFDEPVDIAEPAVTKKVTRPRNAAPSAFDSVVDDA
jgi:hypothetical protein